MRKEYLARFLLIFGLLIAVGLPAYGWWRQSQVTVVHAHMAERGGWTPGDLSVAVGQPLHLRLTSDDVTHGFAVGQSDQPAVDVIPGEMTEVTLQFSKPGKYTFYCTRWCSVNHWRMRGTIEVTGNPTETVSAPSPLYVSLGLNLDAQHHASVIPAQKPAAWRGALLNLPLPQTYTERNYFLTHSPEDLFLALRADATYSKLTSQQVWDFVAWVWQVNTPPAQIAEGRQLFAANCAACHGEGGAGNGVFADQLAAASTEMTGMQGEHTQRPADFTDPNHMLSASPAHLQGKILRGGMGTGMPYWGPIFTEDQTWSIVAFLWTFQFDLEVKP